MNSVNNVDYHNKKFYVNIVYRIYFGNHDKKSNYNMFNS